MEKIKKYLEYYWNITDYYERYKSSEKMVKQVNYFLNLRKSNAKVRKWYNESSNILIIEIPVPIEEYSVKIIDNLQDLQEKLWVEKVELEKGNIVKLRITKKSIYIPSVIKRISDSKSLQIPLGINRDTIETLWLDVNYNPHILIAGSTGKGKSICLDAILLHIIEYFEDTKLILIDPKRIELSSFEDCSKLYCDIITEPEDALRKMQSLCCEMDKRYKQMKKLRTKDFKRIKKSRLFLIIDEYADLMMVSKKLDREDEDNTTFEYYVTRIAQLGRAAWIHLIIATQRPSSDIITWLIKNNIPTRIAFWVGSSIDSRIILDSKWAEKLGNPWNWLLKSDSGTFRFKWVYVSEKERDLILQKFKKESTEVKKEIEEKHFYWVSESRLKEYIGSIEVYRNLQARRDLNLSHFQANELGKLLDSLWVVKANWRKRIITQPKLFIL